MTYDRRLARVQQTLRRLGFAAAMAVFCTHSHTALAKDVIVHLFDWTWDDVAAECEKVLGPNGFAAVQVSPPMEHAVINPPAWYDRYQPVSYRLESRGGNAEQFKSMVHRCRAVDVDIYVDAVINHMAGRPDGERKGYAGSVYSNYKFPGLYEPWDFHDCHKEIKTYTDAGEVQNCDLVNLMDLKTESPYVQGKIADYLQHLVNLGVKGFRLDASKHMPVGDIKAILDRVPQAGFIYQEVIPGDGEPIQPEHYLGNGSVTDFVYGRELARVFQHGNLAWLKAFDASWQENGSGPHLLPSDHAVVFTDNHDNQRENKPVLTFKNGALHELTNIFMLAWPHGRPQLMSSYEFSTQKQPSPQHRVYPNGCGKEWVCEHSHKAILHMVGFRNAVGAAPVTLWWDNGANLIAFGRGDKGFIVINNEDTPQTRMFHTGLAAGHYCDVLMKSPASGICSKTVDVSGSGEIQVTVLPHHALAIHIGARP